MSWCRRDKALSSSVVNVLDFLKVVRLVFWSGVVGPGFRSLALRAHCRATRSKARLVSKSINVSKGLFTAHSGANFRSA